MNDFLPQMIIKLNLTTVFSTSRNSLACKQVVARWILLEAVFGHGPSTQSSAA